MKKELYIFISLVAVFSLVLVQSAQAGAIEAAFFTVTPAVKYGDRVSDYNVSFVVASSTEVESRIRLIFPGGFALPSTMATSSITSSAGGSEVVASATVSGSEVTIWFADGAVTTASDTIEISNIPGMKNPGGGGSFTLGIEARTLANDLSDQGSSTAFTIIASPATAPPPAPTYGFVSPPTSQIAVPAAGITISAGTPYIISGTSIDSGPYAVTKVEVSVDGGSTWLAARVEARGVGEYSWKYTWANPTPGSYTVQVRGTDSAGNVETPSAGVKVTVAGLVTPTPTPTPVVEKPIAQMTVPELQAKITQLQQQLLVLLQQLIQILTAQL